MTKDDEKDRKGAAMKKPHSSVESKQNNKRIRSSEEVGRSPDEGGPGGPAVPDTSSNKRSKGSEKTKLVASGPTKNHQRYRADGRKLVAKNSLREAELLAAKEKARMKERASMTEEEKTEERRAANRLAAYQSRQRRKITIEGLEEQVQDLSKTVSRQDNKISQLERENKRLKAENRELREEMALLKQSAKKEAARKTQEKEQEPQPVWTNSEGSASSTTMYSNVQQQTHHPAPTEANTTIDASTFLNAVGLTTSQLSALLSPQDESQAAPTNRSTEILPGQIPPPSNNDTRLLLQSSQNQRSNPIANNVDHLNALLLRQLQQQQEIAILGPQPSQPPRGGGPSISLVPNESTNSSFSNSADPNEDVCNLLLRILTSQASRTAAPVDTALSQRQQQQEPSLPRRQEGSYNSNPEGHETLEEYLKRHYRQKGNGGGRNG